MPLKDAILANSALSVYPFFTNGNFIVNHSAMLHKASALLILQILKDGVYATDTNLLHNYINMLLVRDFIMSTAYRPICLRTNMLVLILLTSHIMLFAFNYFSTYH